VKTLHVIALSIATILIPPLGYAQTFPGPCNDLGAFIDNTGVTDDQGVSHPHKAGWTNSTFPAEVTYSNPSVGQRKGRMVCFTVTATLTYRAVPATRTIMWDPHPPACDQCACNAERDDWQMRLRNHEMIHAQEATDSATWLTQQTKPFSLKACVAAGPGVTWVSARPSFDAQALAHAIRESRSARRRYNSEQDEFDRSRVGAVPLPNCAKCMPCAAGQQPSCSECSQGLILYNNQCLSPCGPLVNGVWQNCGLSMSDQPVACCPIQTPSGATAVCSSLRTSVCPPQ
jgi:hypothetical protein